MSSLSYAVSDTLRGLLMGSEIGNSPCTAATWLFGILLVGFFRAWAFYGRRRSRAFPSTARQSASVRHELVSAVPRLLDPL